MTHFLRLSPHPRVHTQVAGRSLATCLFSPVQRVAFYYKFFSEFVLPNPAEHVEGWESAQAMMASVMDELRQLHTIVSLAASESSARARVRQLEKQFEGNSARSVLI